MKEREIHYWHRRQRKIKTEKILDRQILTWLYKTVMGRFFTNLLFSKRLFSFAYALFYEGKRSRKKITPFVEKFDIKIEDFEPGPYSSFNEFFSRRFRSGTRTFAENPAHLPAFAEARYLAWINTFPDQVFPVKGSFLTPQALLKSEKWAGAFDNGPVVLARLAPQDYHRVHYVDSGRIIDWYRINGDLHSVNPLALSTKSDVLCTNARDVTIQKTENFGFIAYVEVGAMTVGKIIQNHTFGDFACRGDEKSFFRFGGSSVVLLGERGRWIPDREILAHTEKGLETFVELGTVIGKKI
jgi:phosphatidylserine decarboxylase